MREQDLHAFVCWEGKGAKPAPNNAFTNKKCPFRSTIVTQAQFQQDSRAKLGSGDLVCYWLKIRAYSLDQLEFPKVGVVSKHAPARARVHAEPSGRNVGAGHMQARLLRHKHMITNPWYNLTRSWLLV